MPEPSSERTPAMTRAKRAIWVALLTNAAIAAQLSAGQQGSPPYDVLVRGGTLVDGTGRARFRADVAIQGDRIARISESGIPQEQARAVLSANDLIVAPGFIDQHAHIQITIHEYPLAENFIRQGITTILASLHAGDQPWPLDRYMAALQIAPNVGFFAGHNWTRTKVLGLANRAPNASELEVMKDLVDQSMRAGALGLSTGLVYVPGNYAKTEEIIELAKVAARHGGLYVSHMRDEAAGLLDSVAELIRICREAGLPGQVQHHKAVGVSQWGWSQKSLAMIDEARVAGLDIKHDLYPYTASSTGSSVLFPQWALADGAKGFQDRISDPTTRRRIETEMRDIFVKERGGNDLTRVQFRTVRSDARYNGKTLADLAKDRGLPNTVESGIQLAIELQLKGGFSAIYHSIDEQDVQRIMRHPLAMFDTDADLVEYGFGFPHPRSYGTFPRVLGRYVRDLKVLTLEEAIRRMTSLSADQIGHAERGRVAVGAFADITAFDPDIIDDLATFTQPHQYPLGIRHVLVNGVAVIRNGAMTGAKPGRVLKGPARLKPSTARTLQTPTLLRSPALATSGR
jgi:N-acyl-D-amino-acid deacylase